MNARPLRATSPARQEGLDRDACYRALRTRDARFDGRFYTAVLSTGIYCRPVCPATTPKPENCVFYPSAAAAHAAGFRPCLRCRPELAPGVAGWRGTVNTVSRALQLIAEGMLDRDGGNVDGLADRVGVGSRHLRRLFDRHVGVPPIAVAQAQRVLFARALIAETAMPLTEVAMASGFGSVRRFNAVMQRRFGRPPRALRRPVREEAPAAAGITLRLSHTRPYDWPAMLAFLKARSIPGVESVEGDCYRRTIALAGAAGSVAVRRADDSHLAATISFPRVEALPAIVARLRRLFDLDADAEAIAAHLRRDPRLAPLVTKRPGLRVPGGWDAFELAVRAILGQQISVSAASTLAGRLAERFGSIIETGDPGLRVLFPRAELLAGADLTLIGLPRLRASAVSTLAAAAVADANLFRPYGSLEGTTAKLATLPGVGPWTAQYIAMRALREPDAFPATDLGLLRAAACDGRRLTPAELSEQAEAWRPWRAYAALQLWTGERDDTRSEPQRVGAAAARPFTLSTPGIGGKGPTAPRSGRRRTVANEARLSRR